jgi:SAM-dependent methyltransferase
VDEAIRTYYESGIELGRLERGYWRLEFARTKELLLRYLPPAPARVLDVGGGPGAYAAWLADAGYDVKLVDVLPLHVQHARLLAEHDESYDVVLLLGPLYHLVEYDDRLRALSEARRVLRRRGVVAAAAISRFGPLLDAFVRGMLDERVWEWSERALVDGRNVPGSENTLFTTAFFHLPEELEAEIQETGFELEGLFGIEGPGWMRMETLDDAEAFERAARVARVLEQERSVIGTSAHLLAIARRGTG